MMTELWRRPHRCTHSYPLEFLEGFPPVFQIIGKPHDICGQETSRFFRLDAVSLPHLEKLIHCVVTHCHTQHCPFVLTCLLSLLRPFSFPQHSVLFSTLSNHISLSASPPSLIHFVHSSLSQRTSPPPSEIFHRRFEK